MNTNPQWNVIFLVDGDPPSRIILLKRSAEKTYAPSFYTGIGGKIGDIEGLGNETPLESAYRELSEETLNSLNESNTKLSEFARVIYEDGSKLYYFWGKYNNNDLPNFELKDGNLQWVSTKEMLDYKIIPTTKAVCTEWSRRDFSLLKKFTVYLKELGKEETVKLVEVVKVVDMLK